jgi:hypothetical protein
MKRAQPEQGTRWLGAPAARQTLWRIAELGATGDHPEFFHVQLLLPHDAPLDAFETIARGRKARWMSGPRDVDFVDEKSLVYVDAVDANQRQLDELAAHMAELGARGIAATVAVSKLPRDIKATATATRSEAGDVLLVEQNDQIGFISTTGGTRADEWSTPEPFPCDLYLGPIEEPEDALRFIGRSGLLPFGFTFFWARSPEEYEGIAPSVVFVHGAESSTLEARARARWPRATYVTLR